MDKRALSAIPRPALTDKNKEMPLLVPNMCYLAKAERREVNGTDTLIINFFRNNKTELKPEFRTFCQMDDYISQDLTTEKTKWKTGAVNYLTGYLYWHKDSGNIVIASVGERETILDFLHDFRKEHGIDDQRMTIARGAAVDSEVENRIDEYQDSIKEWKLRERNKKEKAEIDLQMEKFGSLPADYEQFVKETVFSDENYIFYSRPKERAYCTKCGHDFELRKDGLYHKKIAICNDIDQVKHNIESFERYRTVHTEKKAMDFEWYRFKSTQEVRWCFYKDRGYWYFSPPETVAPRSAVLYNKNLSGDMAGTCMKYSAVDIYVDKVVQNRQILNKPWCIDWYFNSYRKKPYLEQLLKVGFYKLTRAVLEDHDCPEFEDGRTILETLQVNKQQFNMLRKIGDPSVRDVRILQYAGEIRQEDFDILRHIHDESYDRMYQKYLDMRRYTTIYKLDKYINKQRIVHDRDYFDYIGWLEEMGYDMRNEFNLFPRDFKKAHDDKSKEYTRFKDKQAKEDEKRFKRLLKQLRKETADVDAMNLRIKGMFIRLPKELDELKREGETLHHCVGTYRDKVARGDTMIFFIRLEAEPDRPFYTLEWKGRVIQCQGFKNCDMTPEVKAFVNIFQEKMVEYEEKPVNRRKAG